MDLTQRGWPSDYGDYQFVKVTIEEQAAQLDTLRALGAAIKQHRQIFAENSVMLPKWK